MIILHHAEWASRVPGISGNLMKLLRGGGGAERYIMFITPICTTVLEPLAINYFNKTIYKVRQTKQFYHN